MLKTLLLVAVLTATGSLSEELEEPDSNDLLAEDDIAMDEPENRPQQKIEKRGWWGRRSSSSKCSSSVTSGTYDRFKVFTCPLDLFKGKKCGGRKRWYTPYGIKHTYIQIGNTCYDWGNWNYPRHVSCDSSAVSCCTRRGSLKYTGTTTCAPRIAQFEAAWKAKGKSYHLLNWNCQKYTDSMKDFLNKCCSSAGDAIKSK